jgi:hypothetical protein
LNIGVHSRKTGKGWTLKTVFAGCLAAIFLLCAPGCSGGGEGKDGGIPPDGGADSCFDDGGTGCPVAEHNGVRAFGTDGGFSIRGGALEVKIDLSRGFLDIESSGAHLTRAESRVLWIKNGTAQSTGSSSQGEKTVQFEPLDDPLGSGLRAVMKPVLEKSPSIMTFIEIRKDSTFVTASATAAWPGDDGKGVIVTQFSPLVADTGTKGALFIGDDPAKHVILDNGFDLYFDFTARVFRMGGNNSIMFGPGAASNYNMTVYDPESGRSVTGGFLTMKYGPGILAVDYDQSKSQQESGRKGLTRFDGFGHYMDGKPPIAGGGSYSLDSETFYLDLAPPTVFDGMEGYAFRYAQRIGKVVRTDVPTGWNSWGGGSGSGGYGTAIDYDLMIGNLEACASDFFPWGMKYFMMDDGWMKTEGDWEPNPARFPSVGGKDGVLRLADEVRARGMIPGIWISPFTVKRNSALASAHPGWLVEPEGIGKSMVPSDSKILDLSNPEALDWLEALFARMHDYWGFKWFKVDFTYYAMFMNIDEMHDPSQTQWEAYRNAIARIRKAVGPDSFLVGIAANGAWMDFADGQRISLDNEPMWGDPPQDQGTKVTYTAFVRKYYLNNRVWLNHQDLLFFRADYGLTLAESRTLASAMIMGGGIFKLGDPYVAHHQHPEWREVVHRMLPVYAASGRPLDLFKREYPEVWELKAQRGDRQWRVVSLYNWGINRDIGATAWEPEATRDFTINLAEHGFAAGSQVLAVESWSGTHQWLIGGVLKHTLKPRTDAVFILRQRPQVPAVVHTSRHLLGTAVEVHDEMWVEAERKLYFKVDTVPGSQITIMVADGGLSPDTVSIAKVSGLVMNADDGVVRISFTPVSAGTNVELSFKQK